jgi:uncharacterized protein YggE
MKRHFFTLVLCLSALFVLLIGAAPAAAQSGVPADYAAPRLITVTGEAQVKVAPDEVVLTLGVETSDRQLRQAKSQNDENVRKVIAAARALGIEDKAIQTDHISIEPRYRSSYEQRDFIGYFVRQTIAVTLTDVSQFEDLLTGVLDAGANYVHGIQFRTTELRKYRDEARALAIRAAREKAAALAGELDQAIGKPWSIREEQSGWSSPYNAWWGGSGMAMTQNVVQDMGGTTVTPDDSIALGQISVTARVSVSFELE